MAQDPENFRLALPSAQEECSSDTLPEKAFREAERHRLGLPLQHYQCPATVSDFNPVIFIAGGSILLFSCVLCYSYSNGSSILSMMLGLLFVATPIAILCFSEIIFVLVQTRKQIYRCTDGILVMAGRRRVQAAVRWDEIQEIHVWRTDDANDYEYVARIITKENKHVTIPRVAQRMSDLVKPISEEFRLLHPQNTTRRDPGEDGWYQILVSE